MDKTKLMLISTQVEAVVEVVLENVLKINFHGLVSGWGWLGVAGGAGAGWGWLGGWIKWEYG